MLSEEYIDTRYHTADGHATAYPSIKARFRSRYLRDLRQVLRPLACHHTTITKTDGRREKGASLTRVLFTKLHPRLPVMGGPHDTSCHVICICQLVFFFQFRSRPGGVRGLEFDMTGKTRGFLYWRKCQAEA